MTRKLIASFVVMSALALSLASTADANAPATPSTDQTIGCFSVGTPCDNGRTCCSKLCVHHKCVPN